MTTIDLPDDLVEDIRARASREGRDLDEIVADLLRKGLTAASMLDARQEIAAKFISGEWGVELKGFEEARAAERADARTSHACGAVGS
jgi:plasmid stability protein